MRFIFILLPMTATLALAQGQTGSTTSPVGLDLTAAYTDSYMFRGRVLDPDSAFQAEVTVGIGSWSYDLFHHAGSDSMSDLPTFEPFEEYTHAVEYTTVRGRAISTMGYRLYDYSAMWPDTQELFFRIKHQNGWQPEYGIAYDIDAYRGYYLDFSVGRPYPITRRTRLTFGLDLGLSYEMEEKSNRQGQILEYGPYSDKLNHAAVGLEYQWAIIPRLTLKVTYNYHHALDDKLKEDPLTGENNDILRASLTFRIP